MKYCVSGRHQKSILSKADEIKMQYKDRDRLINYIKDYPDKTFILIIPKDVPEDELEWNRFEDYSNEVNFILCIQDLNLAKNCHNHGIKFYWFYPIFTWFELNGVIAFDPCYIILAAPLCFDLKKVKAKTQIPIRLCPNLAFDAYIPRANGICGSWIRPEDVEIYEEWVDTLEFITDDLSKESTLFHIYAENKVWPGNLNLLLTNFNVNVDNRAIPEEIGKIRANCGQRCMSSGTCHFCETSVNFSNDIRHKHYENLKNIDNQ